MVGRTTKQQRQRWGFLGCRLGGWSNGRFARRNLGRKHHRRFWLNQPRRCRHQLATMDRSTNWNSSTKLRSCRARPHQSNSPMSSGQTTGCRQDWSSADMESLHSQAQLPAELFNGCVLASNDASIEHWNLCDFRVYPWQLSQKGLFNDWNLVVQLLRVVWRDFELV